ncbi:DUF167 domain-containing protein [Candidatus Pacearchaeota archaeon]|nr:DUF167 domain-containing protein [Candidatus Pacearchaeota archaeon]
MKVIVKTRFNSSQQRIEGFGSGRYLVYLPFPEDDDSISALISLLSKHLGVPTHKLSFVGHDRYKDMIFEIQ